MKKRQAGVGLSLKQMDAPSLVSQARIYGPGSDPGPVSPGQRPVWLISSSWVPPGTGGWARHLHGLGGLTCMFVISLTFGDVWGWLVSSFFMPSDLVLCGFGGLLTL